MADEEIAEFEIYPDNTESLEVFLICGGQWRYRPEGNGSRLIGMDYAAVHAAMSMLEVENKRAAFADMRQMEQALIKELNRG